MTVDDQIQAILAAPCVYTEPPLFYLNGHKFCPCITGAIRTAYIGGYRAGRDGVAPEIGVIEDNKSARNQEPPAL